MKNQIIGKLCKTCANLGQFNDGSPGCIKFKIKVNPETDYCAWPVTKGQTEQCDLCHRQLPQTELFYWLNKDESQGYWVCQECLGTIGSCATCTYYYDCGFVNDHSEPQVVFQTQKKGFMTMQTQVKNPHLVQKHCISCRCSYGDQDPECQRNENGINCGHWMMR